MIRSIVILATVYALACAAAAYGDDAPDDKLFNAIAEVESHHNPDAVNGEAVGIVQIKPVFVEDVNRILRHTKYTLADRYREDRSREMFDVYMKFYIREALKKTGEHVTYESMARLWCGVGNRKSPAAFRYWQKVKQAMEHPTDVTKSYTEAGGNFNR